jgi:cephalosporin hydroxylase
MIIDTEKNEITNGNTIIPIYSPQGFRLISDLWLKVGWDQKYLYGFSWLGRPVIQNPDDLIRVQEVIYDIKPDFIIETGIAHGGSLIYYASLLNLIGQGRVIGVDIEIRPHNRKAIEEHKLCDMIDLIEGSSIDVSTFEKVKKLIKDDCTIMVILDSAHDFEHVFSELKMYSNLVSKGSYIVVTDGAQGHLHTTPRAKKEYGSYAETWKHSNPKKAAEDFVKENPNFEIVEPKFPFNEGKIDFRITHWPSAFIRKNR